MARRTTPKKRLFSEKNEAYRLYRRSQCAQYGIEYFGSAAGRTRTQDEAALFLRGKNQPQRAMRLAFSGAHCTGKSSLIDELLRRLPGYAAFDEPYASMEEEGYDFCHPPSLEDFEAQLERSMGILQATNTDALFDRCPVDFIGYLMCHEDAAHSVVHEWLPHIRAALASLDRVVYVPIEARDRILFSASDDGQGERSSVDETLRELLLGDPLDLSLRVLCVEGDVQARAQAVIREIHRGS